MAKNQEQVVLLQGSMYHEGDVHLSLFGEDTYFTPLDSISEEDRVKVDLAVTAGVLAISKAPEMTRANMVAKANRKAQEPLVNLPINGRLVWKDKDKVVDEGGKRPPKSPSIAQRTATYSVKGSKAFALLQKTVDVIGKTLVGEVGKLNSAKEKEAFLRELDYIEGQGYNHTAQTRPAVAMRITELLAEYDQGKSASISPIVSIEE